MDGKKLVRMANDIAAFFTVETRREDAVAGVSGHMQKFWDPRMRRQILEVLEDGGDGMHDLVVEALRNHR